MVEGGRRGAWRAAPGRLFAGGLLLGTNVRSFQPCLVALAQVLVTDALRAREQRIAELQGIEMEIALDLLEPLGRVARRALQSQHLGSALILVAPEGLGHAGLGVQVLSQRNGALQS